MSSSRRGGVGVTVRASANSSSVVLPIAETTTTTRLPSATVAATRSATRPSRAGSATLEPPYFCTTIGFTFALIRCTSLDSVSYPRYSRRMSLRRLLVPLCRFARRCVRSRSARRLRPRRRPPVAPTGPVKPVSSEDDYSTARAEYDALPLHAPERRRAARRARTWLMKQTLRDGLERGHLEDAYEQLKQAATL